ncbi:MAG: flavin oxidoreductase, partial [Bacteroidota bacterium]|nr:flavin oxidoreductase [Bacteroidota bacterium]
MIIRENDLEVMEKRYRAALINSITGFKPLNLCGTMDEKGNTNVAIFSSVIHLGSDPALIGMINRPNTVPRHTL